MDPLTGWKFAPAPPPVQQPDEPLPPAAVILAGLGAGIGALPSLASGAVVLGAFRLVERVAAVIPGATLVLSTWTVQALFLISAVAATLVLPVLQFWGALRLFTRDDRKLVVYGCLPLTVVVPLAAVELVLSGEAGNTRLLLLLLGPVAAGPFALSPSVRRWLAADDDEPE